MSTRKIIAIKRIANDLREIKNNPLEGIGIVSIDNDPMKYVVNIQLMMGIYQGYCIQLLLTFPDNYPTQSPKILIYPGQAFNGEYHEHVDFEEKKENNYFKGLCFDFLENDYLSTSVEHSGWNPSYTISSILLQIQNFLSNPDLHDHLLPNKDKIEKLMKSMDNYKRTFIIRDENGERKIEHTWKYPYPEMHFGYTKMGVEEDYKGNENSSSAPVPFSNSKINNKEKNEQIKQNLTCYMLKTNYIENPEILLGYPIVQNNNVFGKDKIELYPIPELLSYEAYNLESEDKNKNNNSFRRLNTYFDTNLKAANNEFYNYWLPIYINKEHYEKNKSIILNSLKKIKNENEFKPEQIFEILPIILNKMIIGMFNGKSIISSSFIICYFQYVLLFKKLISEYEEEFSRYMKKKIDLISLNDFDVNKKIVPDIGNFMMLMFFSNKELLNPEQSKKLWNVLFEEILTRQMFWIFYGNDCKTKMENLIMKNNIDDTKILDKIYLDKFETDPNFKMRYLDIFNKKLHKIGIFDQIVNIISIDNGLLWQYYNDLNYTKNMVAKRMSQSFKRLFNECSQDTRNKLKEIILEKMNFSLFFETELKEIKEDIYCSFKMDELLKDKSIKNIDEILEFAFKSQRGNQLLIITFLAQKKLEEKEFLENLEKNYGIFLEIDNFIKEMKRKLNEIKSYKGLYEFIGSEFGKNKTETELIIEAFERAKKKGYIRNDNIRNINKKRIYDRQNNQGMRGGLNGLNNGRVGEIRFINQF